MITVVLRRCAGAAFFFAPPVLVILIFCVAVGLRPLFGPIDPKNVDRACLVQLMKFRNFRTLPPQVVAELAERSDTEFGRRSGKMPEFQFSTTEKKIYAHFGGGRQSNTTRFETNLNLMARVKYFNWMERFESLPRRQQPALLNEIIDDMKWWENLYMSFLQAAELPIPTPIELMQQFDDMIESFKVGADDVDIERIDRFKKRMITGFVARAMLLPPWMSGANRPAE